MTRPFRFAIQSLRFTEPDSAADAARTAEELGYEQIFSYDHLGAMDPFVPLMVAAGATQRLGVGPLVLNNEFHHPVLLARTAAAIDRMTGGRLVLGLGTGYMQSEHDAMNLLLRAPKERVDRFEESLVVLRALLDTGECSFQGQHHQIAVERLGIRPVQDRVPFLIGGHGRRVVGLAARFADIFQFTGLTHGEGGAPEVGGFDVDALAQRARWLTEAAAEAGRGGDTIERSSLVQVTQVMTGPSDFGRTDEVNARLAERFELDLAVVERTPFALVGSVEQIVDKLERQREALGISHITVRDAEGFAPVVAALRGR